MENGSQQVEDLGNHDDWENMHDLAVVLLNHQESVSTLGQVLGAVLLGPVAFFRVADFLDLCSIFAPGFNEWLPSQVGWGDEDDTTS